MLTDSYLGEDVFADCQLADDGCARCDLPETEMDSQGNLPDCKQSSGELPECKEKSDTELRNRYDSTGAVQRYDMFRHVEGGVTYYQPDGSYEMFMETPAITLSATPASDTLKPALLIDVEQTSGTVTVEVLSIEVIPA